MIRRISLVATMVTVMLTMLVGYLVTWLPSDTEHVLLLCISGVLLFPVVYRIASRKFDPFEPVFIFCLAFGTMYVIRPLAMISRGEFRYDKLTKSIDITSYVDSVLVVGLIGAIGFMAGYHLKVGNAIAHRAPRPFASFHYDLIIAGAIALSALGFFLYALFIRTAGGFAALLSFLNGRDNVAQKEYYKESTGYLYLGPYLLMPAFILLIYVSHVRDSKIARILAAGTGFLIVVRSMLGGSRMSLLPFAGLVLIYAYIRSGSRPRFTTIAIVGLIGLIGSAFIVSSRDVGSRQNSTRVEILQNIVSDPLKAFDPITTGPDTEMVPAFAALFAEGELNGNYKYGMATVGDFVLRPIPRIIWQEKPLSPREKILESIWPYEYQLGILNAEFSVLLYFFIDLGYLGVFLGMTTLGLICKIIYAYFLRYQNNVVVQLFYAAFLPFVVIGLRDSLVDTFTRFAFMVIPAIVVFGLAATPLRHPAVRQTDPIPEIGPSLRKNQGALNA